MKATEQQIKTKSEELFGTDKLNESSYWWRTGAKWVISLQPEWVSVTDRLPNIGDRVLVSDYDGHNEICNYVVNHFSKRYNGEPVFMNEQDEQPDYILATHWMPLPQPPTK